MPSPNPCPPPGSGRTEPTPAPLPQPLAAGEVEARRRVTEGVAYVYVPTRPGRPAEENGPRQVEFELRQMEDGTAGLPVFTEPQLLVAQLGEFQPWVKIAVLELLIQVSAAKVQVTVNPVAQHDLERWTADEVEAWKRNA